MNILKNDFQQMTEEDARLLAEYFRGYDYRGAGYTLLANYIWRNTHCLCWEVVGDYLCIAGADCMIAENPNAIISMPMTKTGSYAPEKLRETVKEIKNRFDKRKIPFAIELIPGHMVKHLQEAFPGEMTFTHDRDADEYVYRKDKLITLSGRALHKKKNHMNFFLKNHPYRVEKIRKNMMDKIMDFVVQSTVRRSYEPDEMESLRMEEEAIRQILQFVEEPQVYSVAIFVEEELQAFAIGERLSDDTAIEHFEKANDDFRGLYQVICSEFCKTLPEEVVYVNREEDMGLANLRKAKEALRPDHMEEKYSGCFLKGSIV